MTPSPDRREAARVRPADPAAIVARIRPGHVVSIVDMSASGALIETGRRLMPGSRVDLHVEHGDSREQIRALVVRCCVSVVRPHVVVYRGGLQFDRRLDLATIRPRCEATAGAGHSGGP